MLLEIFKNGSKVVNRRLMLIDLGFSCFLMAILLIQGYIPSLDFLSPKTIKLLAFGLSAFAAMLKAGEMFFSKAAAMYAEDSHQDTQTKTTEQKETNMNITGKLTALLVAGVLFGTRVMAQTNPVVPINPGDIIAAASSNAVSLSQETFGVAIGTVTHDQGTSFSSLLQGRYDFAKNFAVGAEAEFGNNQTTLEKLGAFLELRKPYDAFEFYGLLGARKQWSPNNWQAFAGVGASYMPGASISTPLGIFQKASVFTEDRLVVDITNSALKDKPKNEVVVGVRVSF